MIRACVLVLLAAIQLGALAQTNSGVASIMTALQDHDYDKALELLHPALQASPRNPQLWMLQGLAYSGKGKSRPGVFNSYQAALKIAPDYLPALEGAAQPEYEAGSADAVPLLEHVLELRPRMPRAMRCWRSGLQKRRLRNRSKAFFAERMAILDPQPGALQEYGACLLKLKETEKAIRIFQDLLASQPGDERARRALAAVQLAAGRPQDALATLQPLLDASPDVSTMRLAAAVYEANKDTPNAVKILRDAIVKDPNQAALYADFADIAMNHQSFQAGIEMINAGLKLQPAAADLYLARGVLYVQLAEYDKAQSDFEKAEQLDPTQALTAAAQGMVAEEKHQNDPDQALVTVKPSSRKSLTTHSSGICRRPSSRKNLQIPGRQNLSWA